MKGLKVITIITKQKELLKELLIKKFPFIKNERFIKIGRRVLMGLTFLLGFTILLEYDGWKTRNNVEYRCPYNPLNWGHWIRKVLQWINLKPYCVYCDVKVWCEGLDFSNPYCLYLIVKDWYEALGINLKPYCLYLIVKDWYEALGINLKPYCVYLKWCDVFNESAAWLEQISDSLGFNPLLVSVTFLPFFSFIITFFFNTKKSVIYPTILLFVNFLTSLYLLFYYSFFCFGKYTPELCVIPNIFDFGVWIQSGLFEVRWEFYFDNLTLVMLIVVNSISFLVHLYSIDYMKYDPNKLRFMSYLSLFTFFMLLLITGDNFIILFLGWEGVGLCSYLLISFWYTRVQANKSAMKALIINRISDFGLTIGIVSVYFIFKSLNFATVFAMAPFFQDKTFFFAGYDLDILSTIAALLFFGACGKSAQIGLHTWLPDAMEGPTPVSALIHAATMVTAGVFLIIKCSPIFEYAPDILTIVTFVGAATAFFAATAGLVQNDIKKVIAYSTCSQLGYMIFACGLSNYHVSFFHLVNHAFFKALLFLSAGAIIHSLSNEQDMRRFGGLSALLPFTSMMLLIGSLSLMGFPSFTGFYSKDLILEVAYAKYTVSGHFAYWLGLVTAFFTSFYSYRLFYYTFLYENNSYRRIAQNIHELPRKMGIVLFTLAVGSIFLGYITKDLFVGLGTDFWNQAIVILPENNNQIEAEFVPRGYKILPFCSTMVAVILANFLFEYNIQWSVNKFYNLVNFYKFLIHKWYFDTIYNRYIAVPIFKYAYYYIFKCIDKRFLELFGPFGISLLLFKAGMSLKTDYSLMTPQQAGFILFFFSFQFIFFFNFVVSII